MTGNGTVCKLVSTFEIDCFATIDWGWLMNGWVLDLIISNVGDEKCLSWLKARESLVPRGWHKD